MYDLPASNVIYNTNLSTLHRRLLKAKADKKLTFDQIAQAIGKDEVWVAAAFYGQAKFDPESIERLIEVLQLQDNRPYTVDYLQYDPVLTPLTKGELRKSFGEGWFPDRGQVSSMPPTDPLLYRLYEGVLVYGNAIKAVILEKFGADGIMSMVDCKVRVEKTEDEAGNRRVVLTFDGKFLPYSTW